MTVMNESSLNLVQAAKLVPPLHGQKQCVHTATLTRWIREGRMGASGTRVHLEAVRICGTYVTSREAVRRFLDSIAVPAQSAAVAKPSTPQVRAAVSTALDEAERLGV